MIDIVPVTEDLVRRYHGRMLPKSFRGLAAVEGDRVLGIIGIKPDPVCGRQVVFFDMLEELRKNPRVFVRGAKIFMQWVREARSPVHAVCDESIPAARRFLEHYGFRHIKKGVYAWNG